MNYICTTLTGKTQLDYSWIEALAEVTARKCSEDEQRLILSSFSKKFSDIDIFDDSIEDICQRQSGLSPRLNDVLSCLMDSLSNKEIAEKLGIQEGTSRSQLVKARKWLQTQIEKMQKIAV